MLEHSRHEEPQRELGMLSLGQDLRTGCHQHQDREGWTEDRQVLLG